MRKKFLKLYFPKQNWKCNIREVIMPERRWWNVWLPLCKTPTVYSRAAFLGAVINFGDEGESRNDESDRGRRRRELRMRQYSERLDGGFRAGKMPFRKWVLSAVLCSSERRARWNGSGKPKMWAWGSMKGMRLARSCNIEGRLIMLLRWWWYQWGSVMVSSGRVAWGSGWGMSAWWRYMYARNVKGGR